MSLTAVILRIWPKRWIATVLVVLAILYLTLVPRPLPDTDIELPGLDKLVHAVMFGGLAFVACVDVSNRHSRLFVPLSVRASWLVAAAVALFGGAVEVAQDAMAMGRGGDVLDFLADCGGIAVGVVVARKMIRGRGNQNVGKSVKRNE